MTEMKIGTRFTMYGVAAKVQGGPLMGFAQVREKCAHASIIISDASTGDQWPNTAKGGRVAGAWSGAMNEAEMVRVYGPAFLTS